MQKQLIQGTDGIVLKNIAFRKVYLLLQYQVSNPVILNQGVKLNAINIDIEVSQQGIKKNTFFQGLPAFVRGASEMQYSWYTNAVNNVTTLESSQGCIIDSANVVRQVFIPLLESDFNLKGNDEINIQVQQLDTLFGSANISNQTYLCVETGIDINQTSIKMPYYDILTNDRTQYLKDVSDISKLSLIGSFPFNYSDTTPFMSLDVRSKYYNDNFNQDQLIAKNNFGTYSASSSCVVRVFDVKEKILEQCSLQLNIDTSKIVTGVNWVYYEQITPNPIIFERALVRDNKIKKSKFQKLGM